jgi:hypothetical protein
LPLLYTIEGLSSLLSSTDMYHLSLTSKEQRPYQTQMYYLTQWHPSIQWKMAQGKLPGLGSVKICTLLKVADLVLLMYHLDRRRVEELSLEFDWLRDDPTVTLTYLFVALADMPKLSSLTLDFSCTQSSAIGNVFRQLSPLKALRHVRVRNFMFEYENAPFFDFLSTCTALESLVIQVTMYTHKNRDHFTSHLVKAIDNFPRHTKLTLILGRRFKFDQELLCRLLTHTRCCAYNLHDSCVFVFVSC